MLPTSMVPEVLLRGGPYPALEHSRVFGNDTIDVGFKISCRRRIDRLEAEAESAAGLANRGAEDNRRAETQREHGGPARCLREPAEKPHPGRRESHSTLVDEKRDSMASAERPRYAANGLVVVHDRHTDALTGARQIPVEEWVRHVACDRVHRQAARGEVCSTELPVAKVSGDEDETFLTSQPLLDDAPAFDFFEERDDPLAIVHRQERGLRRGAAEIRVARLRNAKDLVGRQLGECRTHLSFDDFAAN